jgi:tetratricopeptide (TPR) repeat protein
MAKQNTPQKAPKFNQEEENKVLKYQELATKNKNKIFTISLVAVLAIVAIIFLNNQMKETAETQRSQAAVSLDRIMPYYQSGQNQLALDGDPQKKVRGEDIIGLKAIVNEYRDTDHGKIAAFYCGDVLLNMGESDKAVDYFDIALDSPSRLIISGANAGLGAVYEAKSEYAKAVEYYNKAADMAVSDEAKFRYLYYMAMNYEMNKNSEEAEKIYREISNDAQYSEFGKFSKIALVRLGTIIE